ncbi:MAG TPA: signal recognition particle-docking protein FtsY [Planctomycetota bacterium]|nr:signal recognition particle-docking protein FtsY [Planctomycetota bacterium]HUW35591.1 signal recognition particle-docking protein FtsY [Planctomycetota bacterium]
MFFKKLFAPVEKLKEGLQKTRGKLSSGLRDVFRIFNRVDEEAIDRLEEVLISADVGVEATSQITESTRKAYKDGQIKDAPALEAFVKNKMKEILNQAESRIKLADAPPTVILVAGVNGSGKTTSIAKLGYYFKKEGKKVLLAASDTFRAAAVEQLSIWSERIGVDIIKHQQGADPAAVAYDAVEAAVARKVDVLIVDTAGRLHTQRNLMQELSKIERVIKKKVPDAPHEVLMVLDATTGQNAISQAKLFDEAIGLTGIILSKLDGTAKGGIVLAIRKQLNIPVKFIGIGEQMADIETFDAERFVDAIFAA